MSSHHVLAVSRHGRTQTVGPVLALTLVMALVMVLGAGPSAAQVDGPVSEGVATDTCREALPGPQQTCDVVRSGTHAAAATCRRGGQPVVCAPLNGQTIADDEVARYESSEAARSHALQRRLQEHLPLRHATFVATHNSYNSYAYRPTPSRMDANQTYSLSQQLRMDVRRLELDVHTWTDVTTGQTAPILCHATNAGPLRHVGCTAEMTLTDGLVEIDEWLDANPDELIMLRVETHLDGEAGYDQAADAVTSTIGDHLFLPDAGDSCTTLDLDLTRADIRAGGQVMMVSDCGPEGSAWTPLAWDDGAVRVESTARDQDFSYPTCAGIPRTGAANEVSHDTRWIRFYDDATLLSSLVSFGGTAPARVTPADAREWTRCGVNQPAFDHLTPTDGRLAALVWTWEEGEGAEGEEAAGDCAVVLTATGRLASRACDDPIPRPHLCATGHGALLLAGTDGPDDGAVACEAVGAAPAVPRSGYEAQRVIDLDSSSPEAWVELRRDAGGVWMPS